MDPNRRTTSLPKGMFVRILSPFSRGGNIYGIDAEEISKHTGIPADDHIGLSDWASINDAHFYVAKASRFSYDIAAQEAAAMGVPRVVLYRIPDKKEVPQPVEDKKEEQAAGGEEPAKAKKKRPPTTRKAR